MKKILSLTKIDIISTFGPSSIASNFKKGKNRWQTVIFGIALLSILPTYYFIVKILGSMYGIYDEIGQRSMFLLLGFLGSQIMVFIFGLIYVMSKYYFSSDMEQLVPLPIKPSHILGSKFITLMVSEYLTSLPIILPFIIIYGIKGGEGILYWIYSLLLVLMLPVIPLVLSSILIMLFMKYTNIGRKKDLIRIIGGVGFLVVLLYFQFKINAVAQQAIMEGEDFLINLVKDSNLLVKNLGLGFPPAMWASLSLSSYSKLSGMLYLLLFLSVGVISFLLMIFLSERIYFDGLIGNLEVSANKGKSGKKVQLEKSSFSSKPYIAIAKKELNMLFKTPIYLMNSVGGVIIVPILIGMTSLTSGDESMEKLTNFIKTNPDFIGLVGIGFIVALGMLNSVGSTTFSREGKNLWIQRTLPIKAKDQIAGRVLAALVIQVLGLVALLISFAVILSINLKSVILIIVLGLLGSITMTMIGMIIDIIRPLLTWTNPQQAMKQNLNVLIGMGLGALYVGAIGYIILTILNRVDTNIIFIGLGVIFLISNIVLYFILEKLIRKQFQELE